VPVKVANNRGEAWRGAALIGQYSHAAWISYGCATKDQYVFWANFPGLFLGGFYCMSAYALAYKVCVRPQGDHGQIKVAEESLVGPRRE
jgi:hypothetical protein